MKRIYFFTMACLLALCSEAAELKLFDLPLLTASRSQVTSAIEGAGGRKIVGSKDSDKFNAAKIGLPGADVLEVIYLSDRLVLAQYIFPSNDRKQDERLRKMLTSKYGPPKGYERAAFEDQFVADGKYRWSFDGGMELVYNREFFGVVYLSYVNKSEQNKLSKIVREADREQADKEAQKKSNIF